MRKSLSQVAFGPSSWTLLALTLGSLGTLIEQWHTTGVFPDGQAWMTAALGVALAAVRAAQAIAQTRAGGEPEPDDDAIPGGTPGEVF